jgi:MFS family permease
MSESPAEDDLSLRALMGRPDYLRYWLSRVASTLGVQIQSVALGWQVYAVARETMDVAQSAFFVGMIGLAAFIPMLLLALPAGETADRHDRKTILRLCYVGEILTALVLVAASHFGFATLPLLLGVAVAFGASRAFMGPAGTALGPMLVPRSLLPRAIALNSLAWQSASILGPAIGATLVAVILARYPIRRFAGPVMFAGVAVFGLATIVFGLSTSLPLSVLALAVLGGADMLSVYVRQTLVQIVTPDAMRGRVAAVSGLFIGASNELGEFESGVVARFLGPVGAAVAGGVGAVMATALWARLFPDLRKADRLE